MKAIFFHKEEEKKKGGKKESIYFLSRGEKHRGKLREKRREASKE